MISLSWLIGSLWLWTISGAAMTKFARGLGMEDYGFGLLAALPFVGTLFQLAASYLLDRFGRRKRMFLVSMGISRIMWGVAAALPWLMPGMERYWWTALLVAIGIAWSTHNLGVPAWMNWMADVVPRRLRGRFFAIRQRVGRPVAVVVTVGVGAVLDQVEQLHGDASLIMLRTTSIILIVASVFGLLEVLCFNLVDDVKPADLREGKDWFGNLRHVWRVPGFRWYMAFNATLMLGTGFMGQFMWLYVFDEGGMSNVTANLLLIALPGIVHLSVYPMWGRLVDRFGRKPVMVASVFGLAWGPIGWILVITGTAPIFGYGVVFFSLMCWPGLDIASMNIMLAFAGTRDQPATGTALVAVNSVAMAIGGSISGLIGAGVASAFGDIALEVPLLNGTLSYHALLFILSTVLRLAALGCILPFHEAKAAPTRDVIRFMTSAFYGNVRQALLMPTRVVGQVYRWSYRMRR